MEYDLEIPRIVNEIQESHAKKVLLQLPDGLKPEAIKIYDTLSEETNAEILIWAGSNFGACDLAKVKDIDLLVHVGHSAWR